MISWEAGVGYEIMGGVIWLDKASIEGKHLVNPHPINSTIVLM